VGAGGVGVVVGGKIKKSLIVEISKLKRKYFVMEEHEVINYLNTTIRNLIIDDIIDVVKFQSSRRKGRNEGFFDVPRQVFCIVDFLGYLLIPPRANKGHDTSYRAIKFIETCFPERYKNIATLVYQQWRHDTVHTLLPKKYIVKKGNVEIVLNWLSSRSFSKESLDIHMMPMYQKENRNIITIVSNVNQLAEDLLISFDVFIKKIEHDFDLKKECIRRFNELIDFHVPKPECKDIIIKIWQNPRGILDGKRVSEIFEDE